jgi:hypothetical protein
LHAPGCPAATTDADADADADALDAAEADPAPVVVVSDFLSQPQTNAAAKRNAPDRMRRYPHASASTSIALSLVARSCYDETRCRTKSSSQP